MDYFLYLYIRKVQKLINYQFIYVFMGKYSIDSLRSGRLIYNFKFNMHINYKYGILSVNYLYDCKFFFNFGYLYNMFLQKSRRFKKIGK